MSNQTKAAGGLSDPGRIKEVLSRHGFHFSKALGQNFLINPTVCPRMAQACGVDLGGAGYTLTVMAVSWFVMALNGAGWLVVTGVATPALEKLREKMSGGDTVWLAVLSGACSLGIFGYLNVNEIIKGWGNAIASIAGAVCMVIVVKFIVPKCPKLLEYSLGIAMLFGMFCAIMYYIAVA